MTTGSVLADALFSIIGKMDDMMPPDDLPPTAAYDRLTLLSLAFACKDDMITSDMYQVARDVRYQVIER